MHGDTSSVYIKLWCLVSAAFHHIFLSVIEATHLPSICTDRALSSSPLPQDLVELPCHLA